MVERDPTAGTSSGSSRTGTFYTLEPSWWTDGGGPGLDIRNAEKLCRAGANTIEPPDGDPDQYPERPHLIHVPALGGLPRDFEQWTGLWIVSEALKQVFESVDPQGFAFAPCDFTLSDSATGPPYSLCNVVRRIDALDERASKLNIRYETDHHTDESIKFFSVVGGASLVFDEDLVGNAHVFWQERLGTSPICDRVLADALTTAKLNGVRLHDVATL